MRIWYFGHYLDWYPRNRVIRKGLAKAGAELVEVQAPLDKVSRWPRLFAKTISTLAAAKKPDVIIVPECDLESFPLAFLVARLLGAFLVYDAFYSRWDALVNDEVEVSRDSRKARLVWQLEKFTMNHADLVLADTSAHADFIAETFGAPRENFETVYIGADDELFFPHPGEEEKDFLVHYNGFYHRLQGAPAIIEAAHILREEPGLRFEMVGKRASSAFKEVTALVEKYQPKNITFVDTLPISEMPGRMAKASVCMGIFGKTGFGERVFPNKGFQTLAMAIPLITRESKGSREVGVSGEHFLTVPPEDGAELAKAILLLKNNPQKRKEIAEAGKKLYDQRFGPLPIGKLLLARIERELKKRGRA
jgi:glycosyltransferase involved in cell wall biosynthesis